MTTHDNADYGNLTLSELCRRLGETTANEEKLYELQAALGHSRIDTTAAYLAPVKRSRVRESVRKIEWFGQDDA